MQRDLIDRPNEHFAYIPRTDHANDRLAIFIHGFSGGYLNTWGRLGDLLYQLDEQDSDFAPWDYAFVGYDTGNVTTYLDICNRLATEWILARQGSPPYRCSYTRFALFGHSLGTLGIRQFLCRWLLEKPDVHQQISSVTLFGTPLNGSPWAIFGSLRYKVGDALKENSPQLRMLKVWNDAAQACVPWIPTDVVLGLDDKVVGNHMQELVQWKGDRQVLTENFDHRDLVKPDCWNNSRVIDHIRRALR